MSKLFKLEDLLNSYYDNGIYDLEFTNGWIRKISAEQHKEAATDEDYWDSQEHIDEALEESEYEVNQDDLTIRIKEAVGDLDEEIANNLYDAYIQTNGSIWLEASGVDYQGDDVNAQEVAQVENGEIINWR